MVRDISYCIPEDKDNILCRQCKRNIFKYKIDEVVSMSKFNLQKINENTYKCNGFLKESK